MALWFVEPLKFYVEPYNIGVFLFIKGSKKKARTIKQPYFSSSVVHQPS